MNTLIQLIEHLFNLFCMIFLVRLLLQLAQASFSNPLSQAIHKFTYPVLNPVRSLVPDMGKFSSASLIITLAIIVLKVFIILSIAKVTAPAKVFLVATFLSYGLIAGLLSIFITLLTVLFIGLMITSFLSNGQYSPAYIFFHQVTSPVLTPLRKIIPPIGGAIDITPMIVLFALIYLNRFLAEIATKI